MVNILNWENKCVLEAGSTKEKIAGQRQADVWQRSEVKVSYDKKQESNARPRIQAE